MNATLEDASKALDKLTRGETDSLSPEHAAILLREEQSAPNPCPDYMAVLEGFIAAKGAGQ